MLGICLELSTATTFKVINSKNYTISFTEQIVSDAFVIAHIWEIIRER